MAKSLFVCEARYSAAIPASDGCSTPNTVARSAGWPQWNDSSYSMSMRVSQQIPPETPAAKHSRSVLVGLGRLRLSRPRRVGSRGAKAHEAYFSPKYPYSRTRQRRITPSRTCHGVPFVKRRAASCTTRGFRERHSSNRDNNGTRPGSSRADDSGFRCVNAEVKR